MTHRAFFGDGEHDFALTFPLMQELERTTGTSIAALFTRVMAKQFFAADLAETIRLGLIGGGATPAQAKHLTTVYGEQRPLAEMIPIALAILSAAYFGPEEPSPAIGEAA